MREHFYRVFLIVAVTLTAIGVSVKPLFAFGKMEPCEEKSVKILILGTYHMNNPRLDAKNLEADDVLLSKRQCELAELAEKLARFKPTKIAVEAAYRETYWTNRYNKYLASDYELGRNEIEQIGFRLAIKLNHAAIYPVDYPMLMSGLRYDEIDVVVGLDPSFISVKYSQPLKNSPFYNVNNVTVPVLEIHQNAPTVSYDVTDSLRYAPRYSFDIKGLNHIDFNSYALLYNAVLPEASRRDSPLAEKKAAYETMVRYIRDFFDVYLKGEQTKSSNLTKPAEWKGFPKEAVNFRYSKALPVPPSYAAFLAIIRNQGIDRGERIYRETQKNDPQAGVISEESINRLGYDLLNNGMMDEAIRVFLWNIETHPRSANVYDSLADGYEKKGNLPCAVHYYRKVLEILPLDTTSSESTKTFLQHNATEQLERLKSVSANAKCRLESGNARLPEIEKELKF